VNNGKLLIADFGLSKQLTEVTSNSTSNRMGVIEYIEPRCLKNEYYVKDKRSDVYSLGVLLWEITSGYPPFQNIEERDTLGYHIGHMNRREEPIEGTPLEYQQLYQKCWDDDPVKRPDINQIYDEINEISRQYSANGANEQEDSLAASASNRDRLNSSYQSDQSGLYISDSWIDSGNKSVILNIN
jgi:serine/threonine protein kinase